MERLQEDGKEYKIIILQQQNSKNHVKKSQTMKLDELDQETKTTSH